MKTDKMRLPNGRTYRVVPLPTLADQLDAWYRKRQMVHGGRIDGNEDEDDS